MAARNRTTVAAPRRRMRRSLAGAAAPPDEVAAGGSPTEARNASLRPIVVRMGDTRGKSADVVYPARYNVPDLSDAMAVPWSSSLPPRYVDSLRVPPEGAKVATKASRNPPLARRTGFAVGKLPEEDAPVTYARPSAVTAMAAPASAAEPPRKVDQTSDVPAGSILATKAPSPPPLVGWSALTEEKLDDPVLPVT